MQYAILEKVGLLYKLCPSLVCTYFMMKDYSKLPGGGRGGNNMGQLPPPHP